MSTGIFLLTLFARYIVKRRATAPPAIPSEAASAAPAERGNSTPMVTVQFEMKEKKYKMFFATSSSLFFVATMRFSSIEICGG